jgi:hypothetical protein
MNAVQIAVHAAADTARRAQHATTRAQAATLREASGEWSILADLLLSGARLPKAWVRAHALQADMLAARAGELAPPAREGEVLAALFPARV